MKHMVNGLVLREVKTGEADRILSILTPEGIISAIAKGSLRPKSKLFSATGLYCYAEFCLFEGKTMSQVDEASIIELFFGLRGSIEAISLAAYIGEMVQILRPIGKESEKLLRLVLNSFYLLSNNKRLPEVVKAVFELRSLSEAGFMPNLLACIECGKYDGKAFNFNIKQGVLYCAQHAREAPNLDIAALSALRHIVLSDDEKVYSFTLKGNSLMLLRQVAEDYMAFCLDYLPKTLSFLKSVLPQQESLEQ